MSLAIPALVVLLLVPVVSARRQLMALAQQNESLFGRIERAAKVKEPCWKLVQKDELKGAAQNIYFSQDWALEDEYVSTTTYEDRDAEAPAKTMAEFMQSPISVAVRKAKVEDLGDEAYTIGESPYGRKGAGTLIVRRGKFLIRLDASSLVVAKRFAKHMVAEVDAM